MLSHYSGDLVALLAAYPAENTTIARTIFDTSNQRIKHALEQSDEDFTAYLDVRLMRSEFVRRAFPSCIVKNIYSDLCFLFDHREN